MLSTVTVRQWRLPPLLANVKLLCISFAHNGRCGKFRCICASAREPLVGRGFHGHGTWTEFFVQKNAMAFFIIGVQEDFSHLMNLLNKMLHFGLIRNFPFLA